MLVGEKRRPFKSFCLIIIMYSFCFLSLLLSGVCVYLTWKGMKLLMDNKAGSYYVSFLEYAHSISINIQYSEYGKRFLTTGERLMGVLLIKHIMNGIMVV